jgi:hypothetical protein
MLVRREGINRSSNKVQTHEWTQKIEDACRQHAEKNLKNPKLILPDAARVIIGKMLFSLVEFRF